VEVSPSSTNVRHNYEPNTNQNHTTMIGGPSSALSSRTSYWLLRRYLYPIPFPTHFHSHSHSLSFPHLLSLSIIRCSPPLPPPLFPLLRFSDSPRLRFFFFLFRLTNVLLFTRTTHTLQVGAPPLPYHSPWAPCPPFSSHSTPGSCSISSLSMYVFPIQDLLLPSVRVVPLS
jgi:hypothetical protein